MEAGQRDTPGEESREEVGKEDTGMRRKKEGTDRSRLRILRRSGVEKTTASTRLLPSAEVLLAPANPSGATVKSASRQTSEGADANVKATGGVRQNLKSSTRPLFGIREADAVWL